MNNKLIDLNTTDKVREYLKTCDLRRARLDLVAEALCMSGQTLRRKLRKDGASFQVLLDDERKRRCAEYMAERGRLSYGKGAAAFLGYNELNSLYRAFRRWYGVSYQSVRMSRARA